VSLNDAVRLAIMAATFIVAALPMHARTWRGLAAISIPIALVSGYCWLDSLAMDDHYTVEIAFAVGALVTTVGGAVGTGAAALRLADRKHDWRITRFPVTEALASGVLLTLFLGYWLLLFWGSFNVVT
jgi:hypothetical protein